MNNKGFTLVELLAVLIILTAIMGIAIPGINSSMQRTKKKQDDEKKKLLESYAEIFVSDHKAQVYNAKKEKNINGQKVYLTYICLSDLEEYLADGATIDSNDESFNGYILYTHPNKYEYIEGNLPRGITCINHG